MERSAVFWIYALVPATLAILPVLAGQEVAGNGFEIGIGQEKRAGRICLTLLELFLDFSSQSYAHSAPMDVAWLRIRKKFFAFFENYGFSERKIGEWTIINQEIIMVQPERRNFFARFE